MKMIWKTQMNKNKDKIKEETVEKMMKKMKTAAEKIQQKNR